MLCYPSKTPFTRFTTGCTCWMNRGDWKCETWICGTSLHGWKILDMKIRYHIARVENAGKVSMESQSVKKCLKVVVFVCIVTPFSVSLLDRWMRNGTILDNRTRLLMKLLTTSSANIIQECRVMFSVKSVSKSIFKRRRNVLPFTSWSPSSSVSEASVAASGTAWAPTLWLTARKNCTHV